MSDYSFPKQGHLLLIKTSKREEPHPYRVPTNPPVPFTVTMLWKRNLLLIFTHIWPDRRHGLYIPSVNAMERYVTPGMPRRWFKVIATIEGLPLICSAFISNRLIASVFAVMFLLINGVSQVSTQFLTTELK